MAAPRATITEDVTSQIDGIETDFTTTNFLPGTLEVHRNGVRLLGGTVAGGDDFEEAGTSDGFTISDAPLVGDTLLVQFEIEDLGAGFPLVVASGR